MFDPQGQCVMLTAKESVLFCFASSRFYNIMILIIK